MDKREPPGAATRTGHPCVLIGSFLPAALLLFFLSASLPAEADVVELRDGTRLETPTVTFADGQVILADGRRYNRDEVSQVLFGATETARETERAAGLPSADVQTLLAQAKAARELHPDAGAITLIDDGEWILHTDGTHRIRTHEATLILKEPWKSLGQISQSYEEGRERVRLVLARTILPDGRVHDFDPTALKEVKPTGGMEFFSEYKLLSGQLQGVEVGSIVETVWETEVYNPYDANLFFPRWFFGSTEPVQMSRLTVRVPADRTLYYRTANLDEEAATPEEWEEDGYRVYRWEQRGLDPLIPEPAMPPVGQLVPSVACSLFETWDYIFDFLGKFQKEHLAVTPEIEAQVAEIVGDTTDPEAQLAKIYHWLQRRIRYVSIKGSMGSGWSGHPATLTLRNEYGDCIDKAILFAAMLKVVGIKSSPVIIATNSTPADDRTLPTLYGNHAINEIELNGRRFHLDATATTYRYPYFRLDDHGVSTINVLERRIGHTEVPPAEDNLLDVNLRLRLDADGNVAAEVRLTGNGSVEAIVRAALEQINKLFRRQVAQQALNAWSPGAVLKDLEVSDETDLSRPLEIRLEVDLPDYVTFAGDLMIFELPLAEAIRSFGAVTALEERKYDVQSPTTFCLRQHTEIELPPGFVPRGLPDGVWFQTPYTEYHAAYRTEPGRVVFEDRLSLKKRIIPAEDYGALKQFVEDVVDYTQVPLFLYPAGEGS